MSLIVVPESDIKITDSIGESRERISEAQDRGLDACENCWIDDFTVIARYIGPEVIEDRELMTETHKLPSRLNYMSSRCQSLMCLCCSIPGIVGFTLMTIGATNLVLPGEADPGSAKMLAAGISLFTVVIVCCIASCVLAGNGDKKEEQVRQEAKNKPELLEKARQVAAERIQAARDARIVYVAPMASTPDLPNDPGSNA